VHPTAGMKVLVHNISQSICKACSSLSCDFVCEKNIRLELLRMLMKVQVHYFGSLLVFVTAVSTEMHIQENTVPTGYSSKETSYALGPYCVCYTAVAHSCHS
jgi:hypothetical protein